MDYPKPRQIGPQPENKLKQRYDGCRIPKQLKFASNLHDASFANVSMADANFACRDDEQLGAQVKTNAPDLLGKTQSHRSRLQLDSVANLINRREFMETYKNDPDPLISAHVYTDGSPVNGSEMQGMLIDLVFFCGRICNSCCQAASCTTDEGER